MSLRLLLPKSALTDARVAGLQRVQGVSPAMLSAAEGLMAPQDKIRSVNWIF